MANVMTVKAEKPTMHVALVGETGVGKSTLVNILKGKEIAEVNNNVRPCTPRSIGYEMTEEGIKYRIWDTRGLNEALEQEALTTRFLRRVGIMPDAERELKKFLRGNDPKIDLVLLCVDAKKIRVKVHWKIYNKIYANLCDRKLKVALVITQMEGNDFKGSEWKGICEEAAKEVVENFPSAGMMEAVPRFERLGEATVKECKNRVLRLISNSC